MLHRFFTTLVAVTICFCASPAVPSAPSAATNEPKLDFEDGPLPDDAAFARAAATDPIRMLKLAAKRYKLTAPEGDKEVISGYTATFLKQERIGGKLHPPEVIRVSFREEPYAVLMIWESGGRKMVEGTIFAEGQNAEKMLAWHRVLGVVSVDPKSSGPKNSARYTIEEFGFFHSTIRALKVWTAAEARGGLVWKSLGIRSVGDRECHVIERTCAVDELDPFAAGEPKPRITDSNRPDSFKTITLYFDTKTWLQLGAELHRADGELVGSYFYRDVKRNPVLPPETFTRAALRK